METAAAAVEAHAIPEYAKAASTSALELDGMG
jgi:hypothetical protein